MCGRAAQTYASVQAAAFSLGVQLQQQATRTNRSDHGGSGCSGGSNQPSTSRIRGGGGGGGGGDGEENASSDVSASSSAVKDDKDRSVPSGLEQSNGQEQDVGNDANDHDEGRPISENYNMSPGMDAIVFCPDKVDGTIRMHRKVWGLVPRGGTETSPLAENDMSRHFSNLMFNARSDTLFEKPTFARLVRSGKTCLVALDGFFEWKAELKGKKQPYFVYRASSDENTNRHPYLLMAGLWTSVPTGRSDDGGEPVYLDTFTILTTEACQPLKWLHSRMPVCIWDENLALDWLRQPSQRVHEKLEQAAQQTATGLLQWHAVTTAMSSTKFRSKDAIKPLPQFKTVKSFFGVKEKTTNDSHKGKNNNNINRNDNYDCVVSGKGHAMSKTILKKHTTPMPATPSSSIALKRTALSCPSGGSTKRQQLPASAKRPNVEIAPKKGSIKSFFLPKSPGT